VTARNPRRVAAERAAAERALDRGITELQREAAGVAGFIIVGPADFLRLILASALGDADATRLARAAADAIERIGTVPGGMLCLTCTDRIELDAEPSLVITRGESPAAKTAIVNMLCHACAARTDVLERIMAGLRQIWPSARPISITHPDGGRA
jgi:hypothetical protein